MAMWQRRRAAKADPEGHARGLAQRDEMARELADLDARVAAGAMSHDSAMARKVEIYAAARHRMIWGSRRQ